MDVVRRPAWTLEQFLEWEERQETKHEFDGVRPVAMVGVSEPHAMIQSNLLREIGRRLDRPPCRIVGSDLKAQVAGRIRYPDALVTCALPALGRRIAADPLLMFEILSESSVDTDLVDKNAEYRATASVQRYVVLYQTRMAVIVFARHGDDWAREDWASEVVAGEDAVLRLPEIGVDLPLADVYRDVPMPAPPQDLEPPVA